MSFFDRIKLSVFTRFSNEDADSHSTQARRGFSLVEMMVIIAVMALLSTVTIANIRSGEKSQRVNIAADSVQSGLREMQNNILAGLVHTSGQPAGSFGIELSASGTSYTAFVELPLKASRQNLETFNFLTGVSIASLVVGGQSASSLQVRFLPPFGRMEMTAAGTSHTDAKDIIATFNLVHSGGVGTTKTVRIDGISGRIEVE